MTTSKSIFCLLLVCLSTLLASAKEFQDMQDYKIKTGKTEISRKDWLSDDRQNNTLQWQGACEYNFAYAGGHKEYDSPGQYSDFMFWIKTAFDKKGYQVVMPMVLTEYLFQLSQMATSNLAGEERQNYGKNVAKLIFVGVFENLQSTYNNGALVGEEATKWDADLLKKIEFEITQPYYDRLPTVNLEKVSKWYKRDGLLERNLYPVELTWRKGELKKAEDRVAYVQARYVPYVNGSTYSREQAKDVNKNIKGKDKKAKTPKAKKKKKSKKTKAKKSKKK